MADPFNPYHIWLGISPEEQPANYYRLLGIRLFETNADAIASAADRQMTHLRSFQTGKHGELTQKLLNEVAAARLCLLNANKRAAYDAKLAQSVPVTPTSPSDSPVHRQPPRRPAAPLPSATPLPTAAPTPQAGDQWDDLLESLSAASTRGDNKPPLAAAQRQSNNHNLSIGIAAAAALVVAIGAVVLAMNGAFTTVPSEGTLVLDWPEAYRNGATVTIDKSPVTLPATGLMEFRLPAGEHHIAAEHLAYEFIANVTVTAGQKQTVTADWQPKATLVIKWPIKERSDAQLKVDGKDQPVMAQNPLEIAVEPGKHIILVSRSGSRPIAQTANLEPGGREVVTISAPTTATLLLDWPADERKGAELTVDGHSGEIGGAANPLELTVPPGKHVVRISRAGFESFRKSVELSAGANQAIKPTWTPEPKVPAVVETAPPAETTSQPVKKLAPPSAAEIERIGKEVDSVYKTTGAGAKDPAKAQELYDAAAKDGSAPAERYVLITKGAEIAAAGGDLNLLQSSIDTLDAVYDVNAIELKQRLLEKVVTARKPDQMEPAIIMAEQLAQQAIATDQYGVALMLSTTASRAAAKSQLPNKAAIEGHLSRRRHDIRIIELLYTAAKNAEERLAKNPADPEANLALGRWLCFYKGDWTKGMPLLAQSTDENLKRLAKAELSPLAAVEQQIALADAWWTLADKEAGQARDLIRLHAANIYQRATPSLNSAIKKAAIEKRLADVARLKPAEALDGRNGDDVPETAAISNSVRRTGRLPLNHWTDILGFVDTSQDVVGGKWVREDNGISSSGGSDQCNRIAFPIEIEGGYDFEAEFTRTANHNDVSVFISLGSHPTMVLLSGSGGRVSGLMRVDRHDPLDSENLTRVEPGTLENDHRYHLSVRARVMSSQKVSIDVALDGKPYLPHWEGDPSRLSLHPSWSMPDPMRIGMGALGGVVTFHSARLRMVSGRAMLDRAATSARSNPRPP